MKAGITSGLCCRKWNRFGRASSEAIDPTENSTRQREQQQQYVVVSDSRGLDADENCQRQERGKNSEHYD